MKKVVSMLKSLYYILVGSWTTPTNPSVLPCSCQPNGALPPAGVKRRVIAGEQYVMPRRNRVLSIGDTAPSFTLPAHQQRDVSLASYRNREHVVLTFFRGTW